MSCLATVKPSVYFSCAAAKSLFLSSEFPSFLQAVANFSAAAVLLKVLSARASLNEIKSEGWSMRIVASPSSVNVK